MADKKLDFGALLSLLESATLEDLQLIQNRITMLENDIRDYAAPREREIVGLKKLYRLVESKTKPKEPRAAGTKSPATGSALQQQIFDLLSQEGSMPLPAIAARLGKTVPKVSMSISRIDWFERRNGEVHIAVKGPQ